MKRDAAIFLMGVWLAGNLFMVLVAIQNFQTIDRLLEGSPNPTFGGIVADLGRAEARDFMRYLSSELNRLFFQLWNFAQLGIAAGTLWLVHSIEVRRIRRGIMLMFVLVVALTVGLTPEILSVGRALDFLPRDPPPPQLKTFGLLHASYTIIEFVKMAIGVLVTLWLYWYPQGRLGVHGRPVERPIP